MSKTSLIKTSLAASTIAALALVSAALPVSAEQRRPERMSVSADSKSTDSHSSDSQSSSTDSNVAAMQKRADNEISTRIKSLTNLQSRVDAMVKISAANKASLKQNIQAAISSLQALQTKIDADTDAATIKADLQSVTKSYRIYNLVMPQIEIEASSDRILGVIDLMQALSSKLQARISAAQSAGSDVTAMQAAYTDFQAKLNDATSQAQAAVAEVSALKPDQGDQTVMQANLKAMQDARSKNKTAMQDLQAARKDVNVILKGIKSADQENMRKAESDHSTSTKSND